VGGAFVTAPAWVPVAVGAAVAIGAGWVIESAWDGVEADWSNITNWTQDRIDAGRLYLDQARNAALGWAQGQADALGDWIAERRDAFADWVDRQVDAMGRLADYARDQAGTIGNHVADFYRDARDAAAQAAAEVKAQLGQWAQQAAQYSRELWREAGDFIDRQFDALDRNIADITNAADAFAEEALAELQQRIDGLGGLLDGAIASLRDWWNDRVEDAADFADGVRDRATTARTEASPLVLDLDGDGIELTSMTGDRAVYWDIDLDGLRERSGWIGRDDALLALDRNGNGRIDDHSELFGTLTVDGFSVLSALDANGDRRIDAADPDFARLLVWRDIDGNGISDPAELRGLSAAGIASLSLAAARVSLDNAGNRITHQATYTTDAGTTRQLVDVWFAYDDFNTRTSVLPGFDGLALSLPQLRGYGNLPDLRTAMALDPTLKAMVLEIADTRAELVFEPAFALAAKAEALMFRWAGVEGVARGSRGPHVDGRELAFVEAFTGRPFAQSGRADPAPEAGQTLANAFDDALSGILSRLLVQSIGGAIFVAPPVYDARRDEYVAPPELSLPKLSALAATYAGYVADMAPVWTEIIRLVEAVTPIETLPAATRSALAALVRSTANGSGITLDAALASISPPVSLGLNGTDGADNLRGGGGRDDLWTGLGDDRLFGNAGDDRLDAGEGNDLLDGGLGNDLLEGGTGNDTYAYTQGFDTIVDRGGVDLLRLSANFAVADLAFQVSPANGRDAEIYARGVMIIRIEGFLLPGQAVEQLLLADGTLLDLPELVEGRRGTAAADTLDGDTNAFVKADRLLGLAGDDSLSGLAGADVLEGGDGNDTLAGGAAEDMLLGGAGDDRLDGGAGGDSLAGGLGNDTYLVTAGDTIAEAGGTDLVQFRAGLRGDPVFWRVVNQADLFIELGTDRVVIRDHFASGGAAQVEQVLFPSLGDVAPRLVASQAIELRGTAQADYLTRDAEVGILRGLGGDDQLRGRAAADTLDGGTGDDTLFGGAGGDVYLLGPGDDVIADGGLAADDADVLLAPTGFGAASFTLARLPDGDLLLRWAEGSLRIDGAFTTQGAVGRLRLANGAEIDLLARQVETQGSEADEELRGNTAALGLRTDILRGLGGADRLLGQDGADTLDGGAGRDTLQGGTGADLYLAGAGHDVILDEGATGDGADTLQLAAGIARGDLAFERRADGSLMVGWADGSVRIERAYDANTAVETLRLADGTLLDLRSQAVETRGTGASEFIAGNQRALGSRADTIRGGAGNDTLSGLDGNDVLEGGGGNDQLSGGLGADRYLAGAGHDTISDAGAATDQPDEILFGAGVRAADLSIQRMAAGDLLIAWSGNSLRILDAFASRSAIERLRFADGSVLNLLALPVETPGDGGANRLDGNQQPLGLRNDVLRGGAGNDTLGGADGADTLDGGDGDDQLAGGAGRDVYIVGPGNDVISEFGATVDGADILRITGGVRATDVTIRRGMSGDLLVGWAGGSARILDGYDQRSAVELAQFDDGSRLNLLAAAVVTDGTSADDSITGNEQELGSRNDLLRGFAGDDTLNGGAGADRLDGGLGNDQLRGGLGADTYAGGLGHDVIVDAGATTDGPDMLRLRAGLALADLSFARQPDGSLRIGWADGSVTILDAFEARGVVEMLALADGTTIDLRTLAAVTTGGAGDDTLSGNVAAHGSRADTLRGLAGDDSLLGQDGTDSLDGGIGDDTLNGGRGGDLLRPGSGHNVITDSGEATGAGDTLLLDAGITLAELDIFRTGLGQMVIAWADGSVRIDGAFAAASAIETLLLADGTSLSLASLALRTPGSSADDDLAGNTAAVGGRQDRLLGLGGNDTLSGLDGADTLDGGTGDDSLAGGTGGDLYLLGQGHDVVSDSGVAGDAADRIRLAPGIALADLSFGRLPDGALRIGWSDGSVTIRAGLGTTTRIEWLELADGTLIDLPARSYADIALPVDLSRSAVSTGSTLDGGAGNDRLTGGAGADLLNGLEGNDTLHGAGGADTLTPGEGVNLVSDSGSPLGADDVLLLPDTATQAALRFERLQDGALLVSWPTGSVRVQNALDATAGIEWLRLADGTMLSIAELPFVTRGTQGSDGLWGNLEERGSRGDRMLGLDGQDTLSGLDGADTLEGGAGNDVLQGGADGDLYLVGAGADTIMDAGQAGSGGDTVMLAPGILPAQVTWRRLSDGDLLLGWSGGSLRIDQAFDALRAVERIVFADGTAVDIAGLAVETHGGGGNDALSGNAEALGSQRDMLRGFEGEDTLSGGAEADTLDGGAGDDSLAGGAGGDAYLLGEGQDRIFDTGQASDGTDVAILPAGVTARGLVMWRTPDNALQLGWQGGGARIQDAFGRGAIEQLRFADGTLLTLATRAVETRGTNAAEFIGGNNGPAGLRTDLLRGLDGDDTLVGQDGADTLDGGAGNDSLMGGADGDRYLASGGWDVIQDYGLATDAPDVLQLPAGVLRAALGLQRDGDGHVLLSWSGGGVTIRNALDARFAIEQIRDAAGEVFSLADAAIPTVGTEGSDMLQGNTDTLGRRDDLLLGRGGDDTLAGQDGADTLDGGAGDDQLAGGAGADLYRPGAGRNRILDSGATGDGADAIELPASALPASTVLTRLPDGSLEIAWADGLVVVDSAFQPRSTIELLRFADGTVLDLATHDLVTRGTEGPDNLSGNERDFGGKDDTLIAGDGDDVLQGESGDDLLEGGLGADTLLGGLGDDVYLAGPGFDVISEARRGGFDTVLFGPGVARNDIRLVAEGQADLRILWAGGEILLDDHLLGGASAIERLRFADGSILVL
jgi:Ca2+-binding RTX toxin-like protein